MKIIILTFSKESNRGANLQSAALFSYFRSRGCDTKFLDIQLPDAGYNFRGRMLDRINRFLAGRYRRRQGFAYTREYRTVDELIASPPQADLFVVGSDQVWNPQITGRLDPLIFFLTFVPVGAMRASYAASFGTGTWEATPYDARIREALQRFDAISVREESGRTICREVFGAEGAEVVLDPTLLLAHTQIKAIMGREPRPRKSVFSYLLYADGHSYDLVERAAAALRCEVRGSVRRNGFIQRLGALYGVEGWLRRIYAADLVITNSFHCMVSCILLRKRFLAIPPLPGRETRLLSLLDKLSIENRYVRSVEELDANPQLLTDAIDYDAVFARLDGERKKSLRFLDQLLAR